MTDALLVQLQAPTGAWVDVGHLYSLNQRHWFEFVDGYWDRAQRPVLGQVFEEHGRTWQARTRISLPKWFSHLLPEGRLRIAVAQAAKISDKREFELIKRLGDTDLPGAVRVLPADRAGPGTGPPVDPDDEPVNPDDPLLKFSLAGAQLKFSVYGDERGLVVPVRGQAGNYIVKFPDERIGFDGVPEAELGALALAQASGLVTPAARLVDPGTIPGLESWAARSSGMALLVERFDRIAGDRRVHMEELAQVRNVATAPPEAKYRTNHETVATVVGALAGVDAVAEVIDRIVLNVLVGNGDAHQKNWAFTYPDGRRPTLSPVYDVVPTVLYLPEDNLGMNLAGTKDFTAVTPRSFRDLGERSGYGGDAAVIRAKDAVERILNAWRLLAEYLTIDRYRALSDRRRWLGLVNHPL